MELNLITHIINVLCDLLVNAHYLDHYADLDDLLLITKIILCEIHILRCCFEHSLGAGPHHGKKQVFHSP